MNAYIFSLVIISVIGGLVSYFVSSFVTIKKYVNYFIALATIICLLTPIINILSNITEVKENITAYFDELASEDIISSSNSIIINSGIESIEKGIKLNIIEKFKLKESDVIIKIEADKSNIEAIKISKINVILTGEASWSDVDKVKDYLVELTDSEVSVTRR